MQFIRSKILFSGFVVIASGSAFLLPKKAEAELVISKTNPSEPELDPVVLKDKAMQVMETYCFTCHGADKQKGDIRFDALESIDPVDLQTLFSDASETLLFEEMPPDDAEKQPSEAEIKILAKWLDSQVSGDAAKALAEKLKRSEYGNVVKHEELFSGEHADLPASTPDRRWLVSEYIFNEKMNRLLDYQPARDIYGTNYEVAGDSGIHWSPKTERGNKFRRSITNPFLLPEKVGVRYFGHDRLTTGHLLTMVGNAKRVAGHMASEEVMRANYPAMYAIMETEFEHREILVSRKKFLTTPTYMERILEKMYKDKHQELLPELERIEVEYPAPPTFKNNPSKRVDNLGLIGRLDQIDVRAIYDGIAIHETDDFQVEEIAPQGDFKHVTYAKPSRDTFDEIIRKCEHDWAMEGVVDSRIKNRIEIMKAFYATYDLAAIYKHIRNGNYGPPDFTPLEDSEMAAITVTIRKNREPGDTYSEIIEKCMADWKAGFRAEREAAGGVQSDLVHAMITNLFFTVFEREPTESELAKNAELLKKYMGKLDPQQAITKLIQSLVLSTELVYRYEFGSGTEDEHGRRMMSPRDASYALAYALTDSSPEADLLKAAEENRLNNREDYEREVRRMLARRDKWTIIDESVQAANLNASVTNQPIRKLRFFRDFFGYPKALKVFKDDHRFGAGKHEATVSRAIDEADMLVEHILEKDKDVFKELLTTDEFYVYHSGDNEAMQAASDRLKREYDFFDQYDWKSWDYAQLIKYEAMYWKSIGRAGTPNGGKKPMREDHYFKAFMRRMDDYEIRFGNGQKNGMPHDFQASGFWNASNMYGRTGQHMRGKEVTTYWNIDFRSWDYPTQQPAKIANRKGILTHPAWLIAHSQNLETDPIHRGKWVQEKLLAGSIPDVPITVDAVIDPDHTKTMRQRMEIKTGAQACWRCHHKMDPLGFPFELYDDFGRFRTEENLEHEENVIKPAERNVLNEFGASLPVYKTLPVNPRGVLEGTGDPELDGEVEDAFDLIDRLAKSDKARQSIIRHAFRFFMGRNESLSDSKTLIDAEKAYLENEGSFDEVIVSLLTSDSFIYRKSTTEN